MDRVQENTLTPKVKSILSFSLIHQKKGVSTTVIGIGDKVAKNKKDMEEVAGKKGKVFLFPDFDELNKQLNAMLAAACGRLDYCDLKGALSRIFIISLNS